MFNKIKTKGIKPGRKQEEHCTHFPHPLHTERRHAFGQFIGISESGEKNIQQAHKASLQTFICATVWEKIRNRVQFGKSPAVS